MIKGKKAGPKKAGLTKISFAAYLVLLFYSINQTYGGCKKLGKRKRVALVAHDHRKADLIDWAEYNKTVLARHELLLRAQPANCWRKNLTGR